MIGTNTITGGTYSDAIRLEAKKSEGLMVYGDVEVTNVTIFCESFMANNLRMKSGVQCNLQSNKCISQRWYRGVCET